MLERSTLAEVSNPADRVRLVVLFGGRSAEHDISCISASHVLSALDAHRYDVVTIGITRAGRFVLAEVAPEMEASGPTIDLLAMLSKEDSSTVVLPILHGPNGEDGTIQGLLEVAGVAYVGAGVLASAVAMDKSVTKTVLGAHGVAQVRWKTLSRTDQFGTVEATDAAASLGDVIFVKPANMGSSIGVSRVEHSAGSAALCEAVNKARRFDDTVVLEEGVVARELECAVLGNEDPRASVLGEVVTDAAFYDYTDKYFDGTARTVIPAELDPDTMQEAQELALRAYRILGVEGMARVDLFHEPVAPDGGPGRRLLVNEVNTIPGFTDISMYPKLWEASGLAYPKLIDELVGLALQRHRRRSSRALTPDGTPHR